MRSSVKLTLCLLAALFTLLAQGVPALGESAHIGLYADEMGGSCTATYTTFTTVTLYILVFPGMVSGVTAAEFRVDNLPDNSGYPIGHYTFHWASSLVILGTGGSGGAGDNVAIAFQDPQYGDPLLLGSIELTGYTADWLGTDHKISIEEGFSENHLMLVDEDYDKEEVAGYHFTFNCSSNLCTCDGSAPTSADWGEVKNLY